MKVSIIIPTYNDQKTIEQTLDSIMEQTYKDIEVLIVDDGSTDDTKNVIDKYKKNNDKQNIIKYIYQDNQDQLNAIINALNYVTGEYTFILHSDDLICENNSIQMCVEYMNNNKELDSIIGDLVIIDKDGNITGKQVIKKYIKKEYIIPLQLLWLGRNLYTDVGFHRTKSYKQKVKENYLKWNTPFWINFDEDISILNVEKVNFSFYKYRVFDENYINDYLGQLNVINGELRTAIKIMKKYNIPFYRFQYIIYRLFNKLHINYIPIYFKSEQKNKSKIIEFIISKRLKETYADNKYFSALINYYKTDNSRTIEFKEKINEVFFGKDLRKFNKKLLEDKLDYIYEFLFEEMNKGFDKISTNKENEENLKNICQFLCINPEIVINKEL